MFRKRILYLSTLFTCFVVVGCASVSLKTFVDPSIDPESIRRVAIFPIRNVRLLPDESREINRGVTRAFHERNPNTEIVGPAEAVALLNKAELADDYSEFLRDYYTSGIPNMKTLNEIGESLAVDAIMQGEIFDILQIDGSYGSHKGKTSLTLRYSMLSTRKDIILWEATSNAKKVTFTALESAPPLYEVIELAQEKILSALPKLGR